MVKPADRLSAVHDVSKDKNKNNLHDEDVIRHIGCIDILLDS